MSELSDEELLLLSNLMHVKEESEKSDVLQNIWNDDNVNKSIGRILRDINGKLAILTETERQEFLTTVFDGEIEGSEWEQMLQKINNNPVLSSLILQEVDVDDKKALAICLTDSSGQAYVVFRGTGAGEWPDNFEGGYKADTEQQRKALAFIENLSYNHIIVIGHSKGGNKAKYVAILSDKILRCVSFDGQGFSKEFFEKYASQIDKNKWKIKNYALSGDFVNPLLIDINAEDKIYVKGSGVSNPKQLHSPSSFFNYEDMTYDFEVENQSILMSIEHSFVNYVIRVAGDEEKRILFDYLGGLAQRFLGKKPPDYEEKYSKAEIREYLYAHENIVALELLFTYMLRFEETITGIDLYSKIEIGRESGIKGLAFLLKLLGQISDEDYHKIQLTLNMAKIHYKSLPSAKDNSTDYKISDKKRDFSDSMKQKLIGICDKTVKEPFYDIQRWNVLYGGEKWMSRLSIEGYKKNIKEYYYYTETANVKTKKQIEKVFSEVEKVDRKYAKKINNITKEIKKVRKQIQEI